MLKKYSFRLVARNSYVVRNDLGRCFAAIAFEPCVKLLRKPLGAHTSPRSALSVAQLEGGIAALGLARNKGNVEN